MSPFCPWHGGDDEWGLQKFIESWELSDIFFLIGDEGKVVPAHRVILSASGNFNFCPGERFIRLPSVPYPVLRALLEYIYIGRAQIRESDLASLLDLCVKFQVMALMKRCEEAIDRLNSRKDFSEPGKTVELTNFSERVQYGVFSYEPSLDFQKLRHFFLTGYLSDVEIFVNIHNHEPVARGNKIILSMWSIPFFKMFTNGMLESKASEITLSDISVDALLATLRFMYGGKLELEDENRIGALLVPLLLLADQFGIKSLHQECCNYCLQRLSEDSVCSILQAISAIPSCRALKAECVKKLSKHFDYCTTANAEFSMLEEEIFINVLQHLELTVTTEERVLDAILMWCMSAKDVYGWETIDELLKSSEPNQFFNTRFSMVDGMLHFVRFPLLPSTTLKKLERSFIARLFPELELLVKEALQFKELGVRPTGSDQSERFQHRRSSFKELQYICDGDNNGVLYYAGTSYGEHPWVNPVLAKRVSLTASSPVSRYTDPKVLASRTYQGTSYAGPRIENGRTCAWWIIDIGVEHQLMCNYYTVRQDGSAAFLRNWVLQGSLDMETWTNLRVHENDQSICKPGQFSSWPVIGPSALLPFRFFRIITTGPTADASNPLNLCICFIELYGYFC
ncbi:BTB/POZ domain-containing protein isoform X2 [Wolffia australiana]